MQDRYTQQHFSAHQFPNARESSQAHDSSRNLTIFHSLTLMARMLSLDAKPRMRNPPLDFCKGFRHTHSPSFLKSPGCIEHHRLVRVRATIPRPPESVPYGAYWHAFFCTRLWDYDASVHL